MHPHLQYQLARAEAAERVRRVPRAGVPIRRDKHPPPIRGRAAFVTARIARRLDSESARRAVA